MAEHDSFDAFLMAQGRALKGPIALILAEDAVELSGTVAHHLALGFAQVLVLGAAETLDGVAGPKVHTIRHAALADTAMTGPMNRLISACPGQWLYGCYNAEYLFYPFCETRSIAELLSFHTEERREAMLTTVIDLYAGDLAAHPDAVSVQDAHLDAHGYFALSRPDDTPDHHPRERQLDLFGGLRWRFEQHVPKSRRRIDRVSLFKAKQGLVFHADFTLSDPEMNTYSCPWHHNLSATIASFRTAKALCANPDSRYGIATFHWQHSRRFDWKSQQLMDLGFMEPGQWF